MNKWLSADQAVAAIEDGATVALTGSGGGLLEPDVLLKALERRFLETGHPKNLTIVHALGIGDGKGSGLGRLAHAGLVKRVIGGHWVWSSAMQELAESNQIEAYSFPGGTIATLFREIGAGRPGVITRVGLRTFVDPRLAGGKLNGRTTEDLVEVVEFDGKEYLRFKPMKIDYSLVMASSADDKGNLTVRHEPADLDIFAVVLAAHNCGGKVIAQVKRKVNERIPGRQVRVPGVMVDVAVEVSDQRQCQISEYDATLSGEAWAETVLADDGPIDPMRLLVARRAAKELGVHQSVNFGFGFPGAIPALLASQGRSHEYWGSVEQGVHNGDMLDGAMFGTARNADAIISSVDQFDFYGGGGIDVTFLGMGELDKEGNVNVSQLGSRVVGPGGFMDITQGARKIVFCGAFEAKGLKIAEKGKGIEIISPGAIPKLVSKVRHVTFSGKQALLDGKEVFYVTERAVFKLSELGVTLVEITEGVDLDRDILSRMEFKPVIEQKLLEQHSFIDA